MFTYVQSALQRKKMPILLFTCNVISIRQSDKKHPLPLAKKKNQENAKILREEDSMTHALPLSAFFLEILHIWFYCSHQFTDIFNSTQTIENSCSVIEIRLICSVYILDKDANLVRWSNNPDL